MKLSTYQNPISGRSGNLFDLGGLWSLILGVFVIILVWIGGQKLADMIFTPSTSDSKPVAPSKAEGYNQVPVMRIL